MSGPSEGSLSANLERSLTVTSSEGTGPLATTTQTMALGDLPSSFQQAALAVMADARMAPAAAGIEGTGNASVATADITATPAATGEPAAVRMAAPNLVIVRSRS